MFVEKMLLGLASITFVGGGVDHRHGVAAAVGHIQPGCR